MDVLFWGSERLLVEMDKQGTDISLSCFHPVLIHLLEMGHVRRECSFPFLATVTFPVLFLKKAEGAISSNRPLGSIFEGDPFWGVRVFLRMMKAMVVSP